MLTHEILAKYYSRRKEDLQECRKSLVSQDYVTIERIGHRLKGNGVTFGFPELSKLGEDLEVSARDSDLSAMQNYVVSLEDWILQHEEMFKES